MTRRVGLLGCGWKVIGVQYTQPGHDLQSQKLENVSARALRLGKQVVADFHAVVFASPIDDLVEC